MTFENKAAKKSLKLRVTCIGLCFSPLLKKEISWWGSRFRAHTVATWPKEETCVFQDQNTRLCFQSYPCIHLFSPSWYWIYFKILNNARGNHTVFMAIQKLHFFFFFFFFLVSLVLVFSFPLWKSYDCEHVPFLSSGSHLEQTYLSALSRPCFLPSTAISSIWNILWHSDKPRTS